MKFQFLTGDINWQEHGGVWVSDKQNPCEDLVYWITIDFGTMPNERWDGKNEYFAIVSAICPAMVPEKEMESAKRSMGMYDDDLNQFLQERGELAIVEILQSCGGPSALIWQDTGPNWQKLFKEAKEQASLHGGMFFGFSMDKQLNAFGATGWDFLAGNVFGDRG